MRLPHLPGSSPRVLAPALGMVLLALTLPHQPVHAAPNWFEKSPSTSPTARAGQVMAYDSTRGEVVLFGGGSGSSGGTNETWTWNGTNWTRKSPATAPSSRRDSAMVEDGSNQVLLLFGGSSGGAETWTWNGSQWTEKFPATSPPGRQRHAMAWDALRGEVILFGGDSSVAGTNRLTDTWAWDGTNWTEKVLSSGPGERDRHSMAFDPMRGTSPAGRVLLFGGNVSGGADTNDLWEWDGTQWSQVLVFGPSARTNSTMVYDSTSNVILLHGGVDDARALNDTWRLSASGWSLFPTPTAPPARHSHGAAYDATRRKMVVFGGRPTGSLSFGETNDTWTLTSNDLENDPPRIVAFPASRITTVGETVLLDSSATDPETSSLTFTWFQTGATAPPVVLSGAATEDASFTPGSPAEYEFVLQVGDGQKTAEKRVSIHAVNAGSERPRDWVQASPSTSPSARREHALAYDSSRQQTVLFGGSSGGAETWVYDKATWTRKSPPVAPQDRTNHAMAYDASRARVVLFGGATGEKSGETWEWDGVTWAQKVSATSPGGRARHAMAYDEARDLVVLFGGNGDAFGSNELSDTWVWNGTEWVEKSPASVPPPRDQHAMAFDPTTQKVVLFGGQTTGRVSLNDTWLWDGTIWQQALPALSPSPREMHALTRGKDRVYLMGGSDGRLQLFDTWEWDGTTWRSLATPTVPAGRVEHAAVYDASRGRLVMFGGSFTSFSSGAVQETWELPLTNPLNTPPRATLEPSRRVAPGDSVQLAGQAADPDADGLTYAWQQIDSSGQSVTLAGATSSTASFTAPSVPATLSFSLTVSDGRGGSSTGVVEVHVARTGAAEGDWVLRSPSTAPSARARHGAVSLGGRGRTFLFGGTSGQDETWEWDGTAWERRQPENSPQAREDHALAYDSDRDRVVLFGGTLGPDETWEWDGVNWVEMSPRTSPPGRAEHAMAYDEGRKRVVLFGGDPSATGTSLGDTWEWDGQSWTERVPTTSPAPREEHAMVYDAARGKVVLFGGIDGSTRLGDTWTWNGTSWRQESPALSPAARHLHGMAYDTVRQRTYLFGGANFAGPLGDTWTWDGTNWAPLSTPTSPGLRNEHSLSFDESRGRLVMFGGTVSAFTSGATTETWELPLARLSNSPPLGLAGPAQVVTAGDTVQLAGEARDPDKDGLTYSWVRTGGTAEAAAALSSPQTRTPTFVAPDSPGTHELQLTVSDPAGATHVSSTTVHVFRANAPRLRDWTLRGLANSPTARWRHATVFIEDQGTVFLFGGSNGGAETWDYDGLDWQQLIPPTSPRSRENAAMAYDSERRRVVLFGGSTGTGETWEWDGVNWVEMSPRTSPPGRAEHAMAYDESRKKVVLFGGDPSEPGTSLGDTWEWDGTNWTERSPNSSPAGREEHAMAYDRARGQVVLFGGLTGGGTRLGDTWTWDGSDWTEASPALSPSPRSRHGLAFDAAHDRLYLYGGEDGARNLSDTWAWDGTNWEPLRTPTIPGTRIDHSLAYHGNRGRLVMFGGSTTSLSSGSVGETWELPLGPLGNVAPSVSAGDSRIATVGGSFQLEGGASDPDGDAIATYTWVRDPDDPGTGPDVSLTDANTARPTFSTTAPGSYNFVLTVADARGSTTSAAVSVQASRQEADTRRWIERSPSTAPSRRSNHASAYDSDRRRVVLFGGDINGNETWEYDGSTWARKTPANAPSARESHEMVYDKDRGCVFLFGGSTGSGETWEWDGQEWVQKSPASTPPARKAFAMAYDSLRGRVVIFGGDNEQTGIGELGDTWEWDGTSWTELRPGISPGARKQHAMTFDEARGVVVLFGGDHPNLHVQFSDTWTWDGTSWRQQLPPRSPPPRQDHGMTYDPARREVLLFGGQVGSSTFLDDTWSWDGTQWTQLTGAPRPAARQEHSLVFDRTRGRAVLFGGRMTAFSSGDLGDTWELPSVGPGNLPPVASAGPAQLATVGSLVQLTGEGKDPDGDPLTYSWARSGGTGSPVTLSDPSASSPSFTPTTAGTYDFTLTVMDTAGATGTASTRVLVARSEATAADWVLRSPGTSPSARIGHGLAFDVRRGRTVLFGGSSGNRETWLYDGDNWTQQAPTVEPGGRSEHAMAYDLDRGRVVLFGTGAENDSTWEWDGEVWTRVNSAVSPPPRTDHALVYDAARKETVLFGGGSSLGDTWTWNGTNWTNKSPTFSPPGRRQHAMAYDASRRRVLLFGGISSQTGILGDTWLWDGTSWTQQGETSSAGSTSASNSPSRTEKVSGQTSTSGTDSVVRSSPPARRDHAMTFDVLRQRVVLFGGDDGLSNRFDDTWEWDGSRWRQLLTLTTPTARNKHAMAYDLTRGRIVMFGGDTNGFTSGRVQETWELVPDTGNALPSVSAGPAQVVTAGQTVVLQGTASDPEGETLTYDWARAGGTGPGVSLSDPASLQPSFVVPGVGTYTFTLTVTDPRGGRALASTLVTAVDDHPERATDARDPEDTLSDQVQQLSGSIDPRGDLDAFRLVVTGGVRYVLSTELAGLPDSILTLIDSDGLSRLALNDDFGNSRASRLEFTAPSGGGELFAIVRAFGNTSTGAYRITLMPVTDDHPDTAAGTRDPQDLLSVTTPELGGEIEEGGDVDFFRIQVPPGSAFVLETLLGSLGDTVLTVFEADGVTPLGENDDAAGGSRASRVTFVTSSTGTVFARVKAFASTDKGTYRLRLSSEGGDLARPLSFAAFDGGVVEYGASNDATPETTAIETSLEVLGLGLADGSALTLRLSQAGVEGSKDVSSFSADGAGRFSGLVLEPSSTYLAAVLGPRGATLAEAVLSNLGGAIPPPPLARLILRGSDGGPQVVLLNGSRSVSPRGLSLSYQWSLTRKPDGAPELSSRDPLVKYDALETGTYGFLLVVSEQGGGSTTAGATLQITSLPPIADAGPDRFFILPDDSGNVPATSTTTSIVLDGRRSRSGGGGALSYSWALVDKPEGAAVNGETLFDDPFIATPRMTLTQVRAADGSFADAGAYRIDLTVTDQNGQIDTDQVRVRAFDAAQFVPSADPGLDRAVSVTLSATSPTGLAATIPDPTLPPPNNRVPFLRLDGRESADPNQPPQPLTYSWSVVDAPAGAPAISLAATPVPTFATTVPGLYTFQLVTRNRRFQSAPALTRLRVKVRNAANASPLAEAIVTDEDRTRIGTAASAPLTFTTGIDTVVLDASRSTDKETPTGLTYAWAQTGGSPVALAPSNTAPVVTFVPPEGDLYTFDVTVTDPGGASDTVEGLSVLAVDEGNTPPALSLIATSTDASTTGEAVPLDPAAPRPRSLRTTIDTTVTLAATATDPDVGASPLFQSLLFDFEQIEGPPVLVTTEPGESALSAVARFVPTTSRVHVFQVRVTELDQSGLPTGVERTRKIRVIVDSDTNGVPVATASLKVISEKGGPRFYSSSDDISIAICSPVQLSSEGSADQGPNATAELIYRWVQLEGPVVELSDPFAAEPSLVVPDLGDDDERTYVFQLFVDDGADRSEPSIISFRSSPTSTRLATIQLDRGLNLLAYPVRPSDVTSNPSVSRILEETGIGFAAYLPEPEEKGGSRFRVFSPGLGGPDDPVRGNEGLILYNRGPARPLTVSGQAWSADRRTRLLSAGVNLVAYPRQAPPGETAESLRARAGAGFVAGASQGDSGPARMRIYLPGLSPDFDIQEGRAYFVSVPSSRVLTFPNCVE